MRRNEASALDRVRERVEAMMRGGASFETVEDEIEAMELPGKEKAALWLLSWSLRDPRKQLSDARQLLNGVRAAPTG